MSQGPYKQHGEPNKLSSKFMAINVLVICTCISILVNWYMYNDVQHYKSLIFTPPPTITILNKSNSVHLPLL